jgi:hypothetical protein
VTSKCSKLLPKSFLDTRTNSRISNFKGFVSGPERTLDLPFLILACGSCTREAKTGRPSALVQALVHHSFPPSGSKTEMETVHVEIPMSN